MKKIIAVAMMVTLVAVAAFAELGVEATITGEAKTSFGFDLDGMDAGFNTSTTSDIVLVLISDTVSKGEGDGVFGKIEIKEFQIAFASTEEYNGDNDDLITPSTDDDADLYMDLGEVSAWIYFTPEMFLKIANTSVDYTYADSVQDGDHNAVQANPEVNGGLTFGVDTETFDLNVKAGTKNDWDNGNSSFVAAVDMALDLGVIKVEAYDALVAYGQWDMYAGAKVSLDINEGFLTAYGAIDLDLLNGFDFDIDGGVKLVPVEGLEVYADMSYQYTGTNGFELKAGAKYSSDFTVGANFMAYDNFDVLAIDAELSYNIALEGDNYIKPYANAMFILEGAYESATGFDMRLKAGVEMMIIENVVFDVVYDCYDKDDKVDGASVPHGLISGNAGEIVVSAKISY